MNANVGELIADAGLSLDQIHALLLEPTARNVEIAAASLTRAIGRIEALQLCIAAQGPLATASHDSVRGLRDRLASLASLLRHAAAYHTRLLQAMMDAERSVPSSPSLRMAGGVHLHA